MAYVRYICFIPTYGIITSKPIIDPPHNHISELVAALICLPYTYHNLSLNPEVMPVFSCLQNHLTICLIKEQYLHGIVI